MPPRSVCTNSDIDALASAHARFRSLGEGSVLLEKNKMTGIATITLQHQEKKNALSGQMMVQLADAVSELESWQEGRGLIFRAVGDFFCSGGDLTVVQKISNNADGDLMCRLMQDTTTRLHRLPLVSVCLVHGRAIGGGAELTTATDFRLFTEAGRVQFVQGFMGVSTGWGGGTRLARLLGARKALDWLLTARPIHASEALDCGFADNIVQQDAVYDEAHQWLQERLKFHPDVIRAFKKTVTGACDNDVEQSLLNERKLFSPLWGGPENLRMLQKGTKH
ncbi:hypothetical protein HAZT_HAZT006096 [Hyalella azteca]|nr:hypothetical protein HAZT_HAZT006096 [Hyalella azteca]